MLSIGRTPLEAWAAARIGLEAGQRLTPERLADYQLERLNQTLVHTARHSPYYRRLWEGRTPRLDHLAAIGTLPLTPSDVLRRSPLQLVCGSQSAVSRVVTLHTSGTTGAPKRIYFSDDDLERTVDFFHHGMATLVAPGQRVLILLPGEAPDSVGDLLRKALARMKATGIVHGLVQDPGRALAAIVDMDVHALVGVPVQVLALVRHAERSGMAPSSLRSVLLSTDYVPRAIVKCIGEAWQCAVYEHYGMTEMGYGGAVTCAAHDGYHLREADLLFEVIDPATERPVGPGTSGEIVFTTLTRYTMPLIRYRTGDLGAWIQGPCPCGTRLRRMGRVQGRRHERVRLADGAELDLAILDEALFALPELLDFQAELIRSRQGDRLQVTLFADRPERLRFSMGVAALERIPLLQSALNRKILSSVAVSIKQGPATIGSGPTAAVSKRRITTQSI